MQVFERSAMANLVYEGEVRVVHPLVHAGEVWFHSSPKGAQASWIGRRVGFSAVETVCSIPSHWKHPERACPATTWYRSSQISGELVASRDPIEKAAVLQGLMERYQPEGGYRPIRAEDPMYSKVIDALCVARVDGPVVTRNKLGDNVSDRVFDRILAGLWRRGDPGDPEAIELLVEHRQRVPEFLRGPEGTRLICRIPDHRVPESVALVRDAYWNERWEDDVIAGAAVGSSILVGVEREGRLIATARAITDRSKMTYIGDVAVDAEWRGRGIGRALIEHLLDHPWAQTRWTSLHTRHPTQDFYAPHGFEVWPPTDHPAAPIELRRYS